MIVIPEVHYGAGRHVAYLPNAVDRSYGLYLNFISQPFYLVAIVLVKVSVGLFLLRLTPAVIYRRFIWGMQIFMGIYTTVALCRSSPLNDGQNNIDMLEGTILTQCRPLTVIWDPSVKNAVCFSPPALRACAYFNAGKHRSNWPPSQNLIIIRMRYFRRSRLCSSSNSYALENPT